MVERLNGIQEVRGSIPLTSIDGMVGRDRWPVETGRVAGIAQLVEHNLAKVGVAGSSPVSRSGVMHAASRGGSCIRVTKGDRGGGVPVLVASWAVSSVG